MHVAVLVDAELVHVLTFITAALLENGGAVGEAICNLCDGFLVEVPPNAASPSAGDSSYPAQVSFITSPFFPAKSWKVLLMFSSVFVVGSSVLLSCYMLV